ncbi:MAG: hypothetical protein U9O20_02095 [Patescibacteria group bacterium]|nr:hypothetical protein [Patescibacteria group bacterium]
MAKFYIALALILMFPGFFLARAVFAGKYNDLSVFEKAVIVFSFSIVAVDFLIISANFFSIPLVRITIVLMIVFFCAVCAFVYKRRCLHGKQANELDKTKTNISFTTLKNVSYRQMLLFLTILFLILIVRSGYVVGGIMPQTTDLGHHMYWAKDIVQTGALPSYGMPDFIIGEHIIFATIAIISGLPFVSAMPVLVLFLINIFSLFSMLILAYRIGENFLSSADAKKVAFLTFLISGLFYAISSPQTKFVSGGVIGNVVGNLFIPLTLYFFLMTIKNRDKNFAMGFVLSIAALVYTHHLSLFIFVYVFIGLLLFSVVSLLLVSRLNLRKFFNTLYFSVKPFFGGRNILLLFVFVLFVLFVHPPSYLNPSAIDTAVGVPVKATRTGLALDSIVKNTGPWRFFYSVIGIVIVLGVFALKVFVDGSRKKFPSETLLSIMLPISWMTMILLMSAYPSLLRVDIPSNRIVSYITFPATILSAIGIVYVLSFAQKNYTKQIFTVLFLVIFGTGFLSGFSDVSDSARDSQSNFREVKQTYFATEHLTGLVEDEEMVLKDHIYLSGDTWIKLFFMNGYKFPLSRSHLKRYNDPNSKRETCTRDMIAIPDSEIGMDCFERTNVRYIMLENGSENYQFDVSDNFSRVYASDSAVIYMKN